MKNQIDIKNVVGHYVVCEMKDTNMIAEVKRAIKDTFNNKVELWGSWSCKGTFHGDWGHQHADKCRYATVEEIDQECLRHTFVKRHRKPNEFHAGDVVTDDVYALRILHVNDDRAAVQILNSNRTYEIAVSELEILFFAEDMAG